MYIKKLEVALSPCPNDVFFLAGLILKKLSTSLDFSFTFADIETLNEFLLQGKFPVLKASFAIYGEVYKEYEILGAGSALGFGAGPILVARRPIKEDELSNVKIAIPGKHTTAHFLWNYFYNHLKVEKVFLPFDQIIPALLKGQVDLGLLIHEGRFVYEKYGLHLISDLGALWEKETKAPLPLGGFFIKRDLSKELKDEILKAFRKSLDYAQGHKEEILPLLKKYAQELDTEIIYKHIETYVNKYTYKLEDKGLKGLDFFLKVMGIKGELLDYLWEDTSGIS